MQRAAEAIVRQWTSQYFGVSIEEARRAVEQHILRGRRLGPEMAREWAWQEWADQEPPATVDLTLPEQRRPIDLTEQEHVEQGVSSHGRDRR